MATQAVQAVTKYPPNTFCWIDLSSTDQAKSKEFYTQLMGWTYVDMPMGNDQFYTMFQLHGKDVAGCGPMQAEQQQQGMPSYWASYIAVTDADAIAEKAVAAGGAIMAPPFDVFDSGRMAVIQDPSGGIFGVWQPINHIGSQMVNMPGALVWNELMTRDVEAATQFYNTVFGWTSQNEAPTDNGNAYVMFKNGERAAAGLFQIGEDMGNMPPNWSIYFMVEDVEASLEKAKSLGATPLMDPFDTSAGRMVAIQDPLGAIFNIIKTTYVDPPPQG